MDTRLVEDFRVLIRGLEQTHRPVLQRLDRESPAKKKLYDHSIGRFRDLGFQLLTRDTLERYLPTRERPTCDFIRDKVVLCLRPTDKGDSLLPMVTISCDFSKNSPILRIRVGLCQILQDDKLRVLGCRFETPENDGSGRHDFYHLQLVRVLEKGSDPLNKEDAEISWPPDGQPSVPLDADSPMTLVIAFLVSVYGLWYLDEVERLVPVDYLKNFAAWTHRPLFWRAKDKDGVWKYFSDGKRREENVVREMIAKKLNVSREALALKGIKAQEFAGSGLREGDRFWLD